MNATITLMTTPDDHGQWRWIVVAPEWTAAGIAPSAEDAAREARAAVEKQEPHRKTTP